MNRSGPPTIHPFNPAFHKENSRSKPCIPDDDEDCDISSGNGAGLVIVPLHSTKSAVTDDIIYVYKTDSDAKSPEEPYNVVLASTSSHRKTSQSEGGVTSRSADDPGATTGTTFPRDFEGDDNKHRTLSSLTASKTSSDSGRIDELTLEEKEDANSVYLEKLTMNIGLIVGIAIGIALLLLVVAFALYKYRSRSELACSGNDTKGYVYETCNTLPPTPVSMGPVKAVSNPAQPQISMMATDKPRRRDVKEWYV